MGKLINLVDSILFFAQILTAFLFAIGLMLLVIGNITLGASSVIVSLVSFYFIRNTESEKKDDEEM
ncbi:hypothetical protein LCGC14_1448580 [marine sediment metagenome]|uniref:Uncharacterized protein n=1 Tax=marine sediment metagenome TaxID=412755 RepID=A0A0F9MKE8_9ZZZZ